MKTILSIAAGVWIGSKFYKTVAENAMKEQEVTIRKGLERFIAENLPGKLSGKQINLEIDQILKGA